MNNGQLRKLGVPDHFLREATIGVVSAAKAGLSKQVKQLVAAVLADPAAHVSDPHFSQLAQVLIEEPADTEREPVKYRTWGANNIDDGAKNQMNEACRLPNAVAGALMPDAHIGYGLPIGGVLALRNAVCPYAVGVDIACRMKLSLFDTPVETLRDDRKFDLFKNALEKGTKFGVGGAYMRPQQHAVMDADWNVTRITRESKDKAAKQLGTSGSGNHFAEFGVFTIEQDDAELGLAAGDYVALLTHSGSRGTGAAVCSTYSAIARARTPRKYEHFGRLAWLDLDSEAGQEYWLAMNLMGEYAAANHDVIHRNVARLLDADVIAGVENHHNFAWKEMHGGEEVIVHRKGATPAGKGVLGVIPGSMASPAFIVRGKGNAESLDSASHGAGRRMSRTKALETYRWNAVQKDLEKKGVKVLSAGADEVPGVYKDIHEVMREQQDLVEIVARFDPKIVKMCGDGSKAED